MYHANDIQVRSSVRFQQERDGSEEVSQTQGKTSEIDFNDFQLPKNPDTTKHQYQL